MESSRPEPSTFTLRSLFALIAVLCLGLAILVPLIRNQRELARRTQCSNNLKQIGLGVQNFHDIRQEIIPSYITDDHSSAAAPRDFLAWPMLILPFLEDQDIYGLIDLGRPLNAPSTSHATVRQSRTPTYFCPSRRQPMLTRDGVCATGDYACVSRADLSPTVLSYEPRSWDAAMLVCRAFNTSRAVNSINLGGFVSGTLGPHDYRSMTSFDDITDGLSYTAFIGEKAIHADRLGGDPSGAPKTQLAAQQDGTYYYGSGDNPAKLKAPGAIAYWSRRLAPVHSQEHLLPQEPRAEDPNNRFGGWHGDLTLFAMGDGGVRKIDHQVSTLVLQRLGCRNDGYSSLPPDTTKE